MLETIREFAAERLAGSQAMAVLPARHAAYYHTLALAASLDADDEAEQQQPEIVSPEAANLSAALAQALRVGETEFGLGLLVALENFWVLGHTAEGMRWFSAFLEHADSTPPLLRARALRSFGSSAHFAGEFDLAERVWKESLAEYQRLQDDSGIAVLMHRLSISALLHGEVEHAQALSERSLELHRQRANDKGAVQPMALLGAIALQAGDRARGLALLEESAELAGRIGWRWWRAGTLGALADVALADGRVADAGALAREAVELALRLDDRVGLSWYLRQTAFTLALEGRTAEAGRIWGAVGAASAFVPGGPWPRDTEALEQRMLAVTDAAFEHGREQGRHLTLEVVAAEALG